MSNWLRAWFPVPADYGRPAITADVIAGLTVGVLLVPQAIAYGMLAGVPPVYGLYAALVTLIGYALLASTPHTSIGPTALASLLCLNGIIGLAEPETEQFITYAIILGGLTGVLQLIFGLLRFGGIGSLLSRPVLSGFVSAAAILIIVSQLDAFLGIETERTRFFHDTILGLVRNLGITHLPSLLLGLGTLGLLIGAEKWLPKKFPTMLVLLAASTLAIASFGQSWGVVTVKDVPSGLPSFTLQPVTWGVILQLLPVAAVIALLSFIETLSIGKAFSPRHDYYRIKPDRELLALGVSKILGAFFQSIPTSASFSRSAVAEGAGARTNLSSLVAALLVILTLLFLTPAFYYLPIPVLAALIMYSVRNLFDFREMKRLYRLAPKEFATLMLTFVFTLFAGLQYGVAGGVLLSLYYVFARAARPHLAELGRVPGTNAFRNRDRFSGAEVDDRILILRFDAELYFGNAEYFRNQLEKLVMSRGDALRAVVIDGHTIHDIDTSGLFALSQFLNTLECRGVDLYLCGMIGPVRDMLFKCGLMESMGAEHFFLSIQDALTHIEEERGERGWDLPAVQHD